MKRPYRQILVVLPNETIDKIDKDAAVQDLDRSLMIDQILEKYYIDREIREYYEETQKECLVQKAANEAFRNMVDTMNKGEADGNR